MYNTNCRFSSKLKGCSPLYIQKGDYSNSAISEFSAGTSSMNS